MKTATVKELKDDAIVTIQVNKAYYAMTKSVLFTLFTYLQKEQNTEEILKNITSKSFNELSTDLEKSFYTITLLLAEIENQAVKNNLFEEKEINEETLQNDLKASEEAKD